MQKFLKRYYLLFTALVFAAFLISFVLPFCMSIYLSFVHFNSFTDFQWVGISNFVEIFTLGSPFLNALLLTLKFAGICVISVNIISFIIAFILKRGFEGSKLFKSAFFMPSVLGGIVLGYVWQIIILSALNSLALNPSDISEYGSFQLALIMNWQLIGYMILIYTGSFNTISEEVLEAARTDGASPFRILISIKIPSFMPAVTISIFLSAFNAFKIFEQNLVLAQGSSDFPQMLVLNIFNTFYKEQDLIGQAGAQTVIFFVIAAILSFIAIRAIDKRGIPDE